MPRPERPADAQIPDGIIQENPGRILVQQSIHLAIEPLSFCDVYGGACGVDEAVDARIVVPEPPGSSKA